MNRTLIFIHIPKTGGSSLLNTLIGYESEEWKTLCVPDYGDFSEYGKMASQVNAVIGHIPYGIHRYMGDRAYDYMTILRHPVERAFSSFYFYSDEITGPTMENFVNGPEGHRIKNALVRQLCGKQISSTDEINEDDFRIALANLNSFKYIGFTKELDKLFERVKKDYSLPTSLPWLNKTRCFTLSELNGPDADLIASHNELDIRLFNEAKNL